MNTKRRIGKELTKLSDYYSARSWECGICPKLVAYAINDRESDLISSWIKRTVETWEHYSGNESYPVPHSEYDPPFAYETLPLWGKNEYGNLRRDLVRHLLNNLESLEL